MGKELLMLEQDEIVGFSYSFCSCLLGKLKQLQKEDRIFEKDSSYVELGRANLRKVAHIIILFLRKQLNYKLVESLPSSTKEEVDEIINLIEEFLAIFKMDEHHSSD
ncbi:hypothetical protein KAJ38_03025 [Candidatus Pacearchaeota archaeon]|nr:hypothetical protein [Candidatus Pacearchaeota archaeon]